LIPILKKTQYQHHSNVANARTVFTIHNLAYQGIFSPEWIHRLGLPSQYFHLDGYEFHNQINCMKGGIEGANAITTVSPTYALEIMTPEYGCELEGFLHNHADRLSGIVNGLDIEDWDPTTDTAIAVNFGPDDSTGKQACKKALQEQTGLTVDARVPLLTLISRLADQKGIDLMIANIQTWLNRGYQLAILGSGDGHSEWVLSELAAANPTQMYFYKGFNENLARQIYAAGDMFLMPSRFEPCGLGQLMAMRYGNVPVVRATGGLKDTVIDYNHDQEQCTGFHFADASPIDFDNALEQAIHVFRDEATWSGIRTRALKRDSSWEASAQEYVKLYEHVLHD